MKLYILVVCCCAQFATSAKVLPTRLPQLCPKSHPDYSGCMQKVLSKWGPHLLKGIREINFPRLAPLSVPLFVSNRTLSEEVSISAVLKDMQFRGFEAAELKGFKFDTDNLVGSLHLNIPRFWVYIDFEVQGRFMAFDLHNSGYFRGNFTNLDLNFKFSLKPIERLGVKYYTVDDFKTTGTIGDGHITLTSKNPEEQFFVDMLSSFYNEDPQRSMDAVQPIFDESLAVFFRSLIKNVLEVIPANELIPE